MTALLTPSGTVTPPPKPVVVAVPPAAPAPPQFLPLYRIPVAEYERWTALGLFDTGPKVELLNGYLVEKMAINPPHVYAVHVFILTVPGRLPKGWTLRSQASAVVGGSVPEPDVSIVRGDHKTYRGRHPNAADVGIAIEVADSSLRGDRTDKLAVYARAGIPEYWIVNIPDRQVEVYTLPQPDGTYAHRQDYPTAAAVPVTLDGVKVFDLPVDELF